MDVEETKRNIDTDKQAADLVHKCCDELEQAIQAATNRGLIVDIEMERSLSFGQWIKRPLKARIRRDLTYGQ